MSSTVRIEEEDKDRLRRLQEAWAKLRGERPSQKELLGRGLAYLEKNQQDFLDEAGWVPRSEAEIEQIQARSRDMGNWSAREIDDILYS